MTALSSSESKPRLRRPVASSFPIPRRRSRSKVRSSPWDPAGATRAASSSRSRSRSAPDEVEQKRNAQMSAKEVKFSVDARDRMMHGIDILTNAVRVTLGPKGRNVLLDKSYGAPRITKDGVTVAKEIELEDKFENMGAQMVREVASKTSDQAGDGTTTATVLAQAIVRE